MNKASERYNTKVEIPISVILETIFSDDNKDVETLCRWAKKYGFVNLEDKYYKLQEDYTKQSFYIWLSKKERKQYDYEDYLLNKNEQLQQRIDKAIEFIKEHNIVGMNKEYLPRGYECCYSGELMEILKGGNDE